MEQLKSSFLFCQKVAFEQLWPAFWSPQETVGMQPLLGLQKPLDTIEAQLHLHSKGSGDRTPINIKGHLYLQRPLRCRIIAEMFVFWFLIISCCNVLSCLNNIFYQWCTADCISTNVALSLVENGIINEFIALEIKYVCYSGSPEEQDRFKTKRSRTLP